MLLYMMLFFLKSILFYIECDCRDFIVNAFEGETALTMHVLYELKHFCICIFCLKMIFYYIPTLTHVGMYIEYKHLWQ